MSFVAVASIAAVYLSCRAADSRHEDVFDSVQPVSTPIDESVIALEGAERVNTNVADAEWEYRMRVDFPAEAVIATLDRRLSDNGWKQTLDPLNPPGTTAVREWTLIQTRDDAHFYTWTAFWSKNSTVLRVNIRFAANLNSEGSITTGDFADLQFVSRSINASVATRKRPRRGRPRRNQ